MSECFVSVVSAKIALYKCSSFPFPLYHLVRNWTGPILQFLEPVEVYFPHMVTEYRYA